MSGHVGKDRGQVTGGHRARSDGNADYPHCDDGFTGCMYIKTDLATHSLNVPFITFQIYQNKTVGGKKLPL
jgi:hypothetical protein